MSSEFVKIGNTRIKRSNIKTFGTSFNDVVVKDDFSTEVDKFVSGIRGIFTLNTELMDYSRKPTKIRKRYVFVTTYQNDNYQFSEQDIDIDKVLKLLEGD